MALAKALSDVKDNKTPIVPDPARGTEGTGVSTNYFGVRGEPGPFPRRRPPDTG